jgi:hypothetical protein
MSFLKRPLFSSIKAQIYRFTKYKQENELTRRELWKLILLKSISILSFRIRRYRVIIQPNYDFYGWKLRSIVQGVEDLYHESATRKNLYVQTQIDFSKVSTFLELGSNSGIQLLELARNFPKCKFVGLDFNLTAVNVANDAAKESSLSNLNFYQADLQDINSLKKYKNMQWDVIFTWATLIYIHPTKILPVLDFAINNSKVFFLIEQHKKMGFASKGRLIAGQPTWIRDYVKIVNKLTDKPIEIRVSPVPSEIWNPGGGRATQIVVENS